MTTRKALILLAVSLAVAQAGLALDSVTLLQPQPSDLVADELSSCELSDRARSMDREPVRFSWALDQNRQLDTSPGSYTASSRSFWFDVTAAQLRDGITIDTAAPGALIRLNPIGQVGSSERHAIDPINLQIETPAKSLLDGASAMELMASVDQLAAAEVPYAEGTAAFKLLPELGSGAFVVRAPQLDGDSDTRYFVQVLERESEITFELSTDRLSYLGGQTLAASLALSAYNKRLAADDVQVRLLPPAAAPIVLQAVTNSKTGHEARVRIPHAEGTGLWEIHARVTSRVGGLKVRRDVRTAFAVATPTARLSGAADLAAYEHGLAVDLGIEAAAPGRYEIRGTLFARLADGAMAPVGVAHSAAWLEKGPATLTLAFDPEIAAGLETSALEIRDLRLIDQARMGTLHRQERGLVIR